VFDSVDEIRQFVFDIYRKEQTPFKISFSFGVIQEEQEDTGEVEYHVLHPNLIHGHEHPSKTISDEEGLERFNDLIVAETRRMVQDVTLVNTRRVNIAIFSYGFHVARLGSLPLMSEHVGSSDFNLTKLNGVVSYGIDDNLCFWVAFGIFKTKPNLHTDCDNDTKKSRLGKIAMMEYYGEDVDVENYPGFDLLK
jgi:hypothetical protein